MNPNVQPQQAIFYNGRWTKEMDDSFISALCEDARARPWRPEIPTHGLLCAQASLQRQFRVKLEYNEVHERFLFLKQRYDTFTSLIRDNDTAYDIENNRVYTSDEMWDDLIEKNELVKAYYWSGEPEMQKLSILFGLDDVKEESPTRTVINISDTVSPNFNRVREYINISDSMSPRRTFVRNIPSDDDEVTSPVVGNFLPSRHCLFDEESVTGDFAGTSIPKQPVARRLPRAPKFDRGESSCGSSSVWTRLFKR